MPSSEGQEPGDGGQQDQDQGAGLGRGPVLRGEFGLGQAGAAAQPVPAVPGADHAEVVPAGGRGASAKRIRSAAGRYDDEDQDDGEGVMPRVGEP